MVSRVNRTRFTPPQETTHPERPSDRLSHLMKKVIVAKRENIEKALEGRKNPFEITMIGGDFFSTGLMSFQAVQIAKPSLSSISTISTITFICGEIAGAITVFMAVYCMTKFLQALQTGQTGVALRLLVTSICLLAAGVIMTLVSLATKVTALATTGAFFAVNPWLLPVLFFIVSAFTLYEVIGRIKNALNKSDIASQLNADTLQMLIRGSNPENPLHLLPLLTELYSGKDKEVQEALSERLEVLTADMGVEAAIETFELLRRVLERDTNKSADVEKQLKLVKEKVAKRNKIQYLRLAQQLLYTAAFGVSMGTIIRPKINTTALKASESFALSGANLLPLWMDTLYPFERNIPLFVEKVEAASLNC